MNEVHRRLAALHALADTIESEQHALLSLIMATTKRRHAIAAGEIQLAIRRLRAFGEILPWLIDREPVGTVGIMFPSNATLSNPVNTIGTAYLAGNRVRARFPSGLREWGDRLQDLILTHLDGVVFERESGAEFLHGVAEDPDTKVVIVFGDDVWAVEYEERMRSTQTKFIFEGPGKDPFVVLDDADVELAAAHAVYAGYYNAGQACTSPERFYVQSGVYDKFLARVVELTRGQTVGDPQLQSTGIGPILSRRVAQRIEEQWQDALNRGAKVETGGQIETGTLQDGSAAFFVHPTVVTDVNHSMKIMQDETFGPVIAIQRVRNWEEALQLASDSPFGLTASLYGGGSDEVAELERSHGAVFHNETWLHYYGRNLHAPYGGRKRSGWVWEHVNGAFIRREGVRTNALEFSQPRSRVEV
ncbi:aldehyde dehydrogenase family protein [Tumebacillus permanentifrigoris]|uniref:Succinate-semialdehyde dehydrogenase/glutarate-semialdehyde dehydrogenase n=1 Tax=Tumebacillus permanentifrigoris TaxID=378543 RepID=A0A316DBW7_9BACL|nr:aldehyde dehydrogenase family protein [Tumebacillus permanentifrigoris]PWK15637.1 succinate-semialdehyde dehydrogenase/glutarate-semialdehyde dehydrogenase [Tumebacillus permanentifrigoris]